MKKYISLSILILFVIPQISAQTGSESAKTSDFMSNIGQIYVVVAVIIAMFIGIVILMMRLEKRLTKLENQIIANE